MIKRIDEFIGRAYETAKKHGFHDERTSIEHQLMLVISEIAEAVEADRKGRRCDLGMFSDAMRTKDFKYSFETYVKDTVPDEMADVCIRIFDMCGCFDVKPYRSMEEILTLRDDWRQDFGKMRFSEQAYALVQLLTSWPPTDVNQVDDELSHVFGAALFFIHYWSLEMGIDLARHIELKMKYNESRGYKHGKKY